MYCVLSIDLMCSNPWWVKVFHPSFSSRKVPMHMAIWSRWCTPFAKASVMNCHVASSSISIWQYTLQSMVSGAPSFRIMVWSSSHAGGNQYDVCLLKTFQCWWYWGGIVFNTSSLSLVISSWVTWMVVITKQCLLWYPANVNEHFFSFQYVGIPIKVWIVWFEPGVSQYDPVSSQVCHIKTQLLHLLSLTNP